jgi:NAD(P)-dependent dehydrogenase (short-subunit alcohol dehydrogenase family)
MDLGLKGRNAVVLGGTRGIGRAIAGTLATEGAGVAVCARNADQVAATVSELKAMGVKATGASVDITDAAALKSWIADVARELGSLDMLFSNAGAMAQGADAASWEQNFRLDVLGAVNAFEAARPFLEAGGEKTGDAAFVIISSVSAAQASNASSYGPIKAALIHMAKGLARQYASKKNPRQRGVAGHGLFQGRHLEHGRAEHAQALPGHARAQPDRPHGNPAGDSERGGVPGEPGIVVHDRLQSRRRRRHFRTGEFLGEQRDFGLPSSVGRVILPRTQSRKEGRAMTTFFRHYRQHGPGHALQMRLQC